MRDLFEDIFGNQPVDPTEAARRNMRPTLRSRFYQGATWAEGAAGFDVLLDGRPLRTPAQRPLAAPVTPLAEAIAAEWSAQQKVIDPATMPLTRLANSIIDGVMTSPAPVTAEIAKYLGTDLLFYRAANPEGLRTRQAEHWDPVLAWAAEALGARFLSTEGMIHVEQPPHAIAAARRAIPSGADARQAWRLGALNAATSLSGSALLALALAAGRLTTEAVWAAAHVDEDWNMEFWGRDELALQSRAYRLNELKAAAKVLEALR